MTKRLNKILNEIKTKTKKDNCQFILVGFPWGKNWLYNNLRSIYPHIKVYPKDFEKPKNLKGLSK